MTSNIWTESECGADFLARNWGPEARASIASWLIRHCATVREGNVVEYTQTERQTATAKFSCFRNTFLMDLSVWHCDVRVWHRPHSSRVESSVLQSLRKLTIIQNQLMHTSNSFGTFHASLAILGTAAMANVSSFFSWAATFSLAKSATTCLMSTLAMTDTPAVSDRRIFLPRDAMLPRYMLWSSATNWSCAKTATRKITPTTSDDSPGSLVFCCQRSRRN